MFSSNEQLKKTIDKITTARKSYGLGVKLRLYQDPKSGASYEYTPQDITSIHLDQDFVDSIGNDLVVTFDIAPATYAKLYPLSRHLMAELSLYEVERSSGQAKENIPPRKYTYRAILLTPGNLDSMGKDLEKLTEPTLQIQVMLMNTVLQENRTKTLNAILSSCTVEQAIKFVAKSLGFNYVYMDPVENQRVYANLVIPPGSTVQTIFTHLQEKYGVYSGGINSYALDQDHLYIYAPYMSQPTRYELTREVEIYTSGTVENSGQLSTYLVEDYLVKILATGETSSIDPTQAHAENIGTAFSFRDSSIILDPFEDTASDSYYKDDLITIGFKDKNHATRDMVSIQHRGVTDNPLYQRELLLREAAHFTLLTWENADPYLLKPGQPVTFIFDKAGKTEAYLGHIDKASSRYTKVASGIDDITIMSSITGMRLRFPK